MTPALAVVVVGSVNRDTIWTVERFPLPGGTLVGSSMSHRLGGKGANQAVAVARSGSPVTLVATVGTDPAGDALVRELAEFGVHTDLVLAIDGTTGSALVVVDGAGQNQIVVLAGTNAHTGRVRLEAVSDSLRAAQVVVVQGEVPAASADFLGALLQDSSALFLLNLAPVIPVARATFDSVDVLIVNESEASELLGIRGLAGDESATLLGEWAPVVLLTLGPRGAILARLGLPTLYIPAPPTEAVIDTTGAGDAFVGVLAAGLARGNDIEVAARDAVAAATQTVSRPGAASSYPHFALT